MKLHPDRSGYQMLNLSDGAFAIRDQIEADRERDRQAIRLSPELLARVQALLDRHPLPDGAPAALRTLPEPEAKRGGS